MRRGLFFLYKLIGVFFVLAALGKTLDSGQIIAVFTFLKIPDVLHSALVMGLILFELTLGVMMIFQLGYRWVLPLSAVLLVFFIFVLGYLFFLRWRRRAAVPEALRYPKIRGRRIYWEFAEISCF